MSVVINTNSAASMAADNLSASGAMLQKSLNRLSSGSKIVDPSDDAGGLAVSMKLTAAARRQGAVSTNLGNTVSYLQAQDGVLKVTGQVLQRMSELKTLYADPTKNATDLANYDAEFSQLTAELGSLGTEKFNGVNLFGTSSNLTVATTEDGSSSVTATKVSMLPMFSDYFANMSNWSAVSGSPGVGGGSLYVGGSGGAVQTNQSFSGALNLNFDVYLPGAGDSVRMYFGGTSVVNLQDGGLINKWSFYHIKVALDGTGNGSVYINGSGSAAATASGLPTAGQVKFSNIGLGSAQIRNFTVSDPSTSANISTVGSTTSLASLSLGTITGAIADVATFRADNGATQSRLNYASELISVNKANLEAANSRISDVDVAAESTTLARYNIMVQAGASMLTQANQSAQMALKLLG